VSIAGPGQLAAALRHRPGGITVAFQGDLDAAVEPMARALLWACLDECASALVVDLTDVFVDVRGFTVLHLLGRAGRERGVRVVLAGCSPIVDRMATVLTPRGVQRFRTVDDAWRAVIGSGLTSAASAATAG
jgi:anti-anti-sigma factor